ncbi:MAG TPA: hypothetical protein VKX17_07865 [Planctomycetota bacterium]|nr:hypothetical protein [Planctomycetota bacterium]
MTSAPNAAPASVRAVRRPFQFHLSTALILMFSVGGLMWLNFADAVTHQPFFPNARWEGEVLLQSVGWPDTFASRRSMWERDTFTGKVKTFFDIRHFDPGAFAWDAWVALVVLAGVALVCRRLTGPATARETFPPGVPIEMHPATACALFSVAGAILWMSLQVPMPYWQFSPLRFYILVINALAGVWLLAEWCVRQSRRRV